MFHHRWVINKNQFPRWIQDLNIDEYHKDHSSISSSWLKKSFSSLNSFCMYPFAPDKNKRDYNFGSMTHTLLFEAPKFSTEYKVMFKKDLPEPSADFRNASNKEYKNDIIDSGLIPVTEDDYMIALTLVNDSLKNPLIHACVTKGIKELSIYFNCQETGLPLKVRPDVYLEMKNNTIMVIDAKTTEDVRLNKFVRSASEYDYPIQAAMQVDGIEAITGKKVSMYLYLALGKEYPYEPCLYRLTEEDIEQARYMYRKKLYDIANCVSSGVWPGPADTYFIDAGIDPNQFGIVDLKLPPWYYSKYS